jgi:hypothetical protein
MGLVFFVENLYSVSGLFLSFKGVGVGSLSQKFNRGRR